MEQSRFLTYLKTLFLEHRRVWAIILAAFVTTRIALVTASVVVMRIIPARTCNECAHLPAGPALDMWYRWDVGFYESIALYGYHWFEDRQPTADMAFYPLYPLALRAANKAVGCVGRDCEANWLWSCRSQLCTTISGLAISNGLLLVSAWFLYLLARKRFGHKVGVRSIWLLMLAPNAIFFSGIYTESLFLFLALLTFVALDRDRFALAVGAACLAGLTRSVGVALYLPLLLYAWRHSPDRRVGRLLLAQLPVLVQAGYILYMGFYVHEPLAYFTANREIWGRTFSRLPDELGAYIRGDAWLWGVGPTWLNLAFTLLYLVLTVFSFTIDLPMGLYATVALLLPIYSGTLLGMPRFGAVIFPLYIVLARWADRIYGQVLVYGASAAMALLIAARFVTWYFIT